MPKLIMCLSCGQNFKTEKEGLDHAEFYRQEEERTRHFLEHRGGMQKISWNTTFAAMDGPPRDQYIPAHTVQISDPVRLG